MEDQALERTNRINLLFDFYGPLLTDKQQSILSLYYQDNFSLGEIAAELSVSRQAVYEHVKRAEQALAEYEGKLGLAGKFKRRQELVEKLEQVLGEHGLAGQPHLQSIMDELQSLDAATDLDFD